MPDKLKPCPFCAEPVRVEAIKCKHCGSEIKRKDGTASMGCAVLLIIGVIIGMVSMIDSHERKVSPAAENIDLNDAKALDAKFGIAATIHCGDRADDYLRSISKYAFRWDDMGTFDARFDRFLEHVPSPGVLNEVSSKVALQNGFGAYERINLYCQYDTQHEKVLGYSINSPALDQNP